jgi:hypothetical protein
MTEIKTKIEIRYKTSESSTEPAKTKDEFIAYLSSLKKNTLNNLNLSDFVASYYFTDSGLEGFKSDSFINSGSTSSAEQIGALNLDNVVKTIDLFSYIKLVESVKATGESTNIVWEELLDEAELSS